MIPGVYQSDEVKPPLPYAFAAAHPPYRLRNTMQEQKVAMAMEMEMEMEMG